MSQKAHIANSFQTPNFIVDRLMQFLLPEEVVVLQFIVRHTLGWQDRTETRSGYISLSTFEHGFATRDGQHFGGCGLSRKKIVAALKALEKFGIVWRSSNYTQDGKEIMLVLDEDAIDWAGLQARAELRTARNRKRASRTAASSAAPSATQAHPIPHRHTLFHTGTKGGAWEALEVVPGWHTYKPIQTQSNPLPPPTPPKGDNPTVHTSTADPAGDDASAGTAALPLALFRHIQQVLVERVWNGNAKQFGAAGDMAKMLLGISDKAPYCEHNLARPATQDEFDAWVEWWAATGLSFPRSPAKVEQAWIDFRADVGAQQKLAAQRKEQLANEPSDYARAMAHVLEVVRKYHEGETP